MTNEIQDLGTIPDLRRIIKCFSKSGHRDQTLCQVSKSSDFFLQTDLLYFH